MHIHQERTITLNHIPIGESSSEVNADYVRLQCPKCRATKSQEVPFKAFGFRITTQLYAYICIRLSEGLSLKAISKLVGISADTVRRIDKERMQNLYEDENGQLKIPKQATILNIDELLLHHRNQYITIITNYETGEVIWIAYGKRKQVVYDFMNHVGKEWMKKVQVVSCAMNSDFEKAFREKYPHIEIVFDYFHIVKNFNEKVISAVRKDLYAQLKKEGKEEEANALKRTRFLLMSNRENLNENQKERLEELLKQNRLLFIADLIKELLHEAYKSEDQKDMAERIKRICELCTQSKNRHFFWFSRLLKRHLFGIVSHARYRISSGKIEGTINKIKTIRRQAYGYRDDHYFFLKILNTTDKGYSFHEPPSMLIPPVLR